SETRLMRGIPAKSAHRHASQKPRHCWLSATCDAVVLGTWDKGQTLKTDSLVERGTFSMSKLRIYGIARTRAFRALWIAKELGLDYDHVPIEIGPAGARKPEYLAINPNGRLPAIDDDRFVLWESLAITLYLAKKHGRLYPATLAGEAKAWQWS